MTTDIEDLKPGWLDEGDETIRECLRGIRALAGNIAGASGSEEESAGARCAGHDKLVNCLTESIVKISDAMSGRLVLDMRTREAGRCRL